MALESPGSQLHDEGGEALDRLQSFWERWGRAALAVVAVAVIVGGGLYFLRRSQENREGQAAAKLAEANALYWQGDYARSTEVAKQVVQQYGGTPSGADALRLQGDNAFWSGDFKGAAEQYKSYLKKVSRGLLADAARRSLAYALESDKQYAEASKTYDALVGKFDRNSSAEFLWASARCQRALAQPAEAVARLKRLEAEFGETSYARAALITIAEIEAGKP